MLSQSDVRELVHDSLFPAFRSERERLDRIDLWYRWQHENPRIPSTATQEMKRLLELAKTPWLGLVVTSVAQSLYVDGYRSPDMPENGQPWRTWQANDLDARQIAVHRAALAYGQAFATCLPGQNDQGEPISAIRGVSPRKMLAFYADPAEDDWPLFALRGDAAGKDKWALRVYDEEAVYYLSCDADGDRVEFIDRREHGAGVCPVVRFANMLDLDGRTDGEVEPFIPVAARVDKTSFDRLVTQHFASWKVRTIAGMAAPDDDEAANRKKVQLRQDDMLVAEDPDTKFGTLDETPLDGFISAYDSDVKTLAAAAQMPTFAFTGDLVNVSADALAAIEAPMQRKIMERKKTFGKSWDQTLRLAAALEGDGSSARDVMAHVTWADMESRSLAQAVDALGKAAQMLGVPPQALWSRIPGVTNSDVEEWKKLAAQTDALGNLVAELQRQGQPAA